MDQAMSAAERGDLRNCISGSSTLNNSPGVTPQRSRSSSVIRKEKPGMEQVDITKASLRATSGFLQQELDIEWMGAVIIICFFTSGLIDAVAFNSWNCFVGMQTGNTVFAALGLGGQPSASHKQQYFKSLVAIFSFCVGTMFFNFIHRWPTGLAQTPTSRRRVVFASSFFIQALFIVSAAIMVQTGVVSNQPYISGTFSSGSHLQQTGANPNYLDLLPIGLLSFEAAGQVCLSRVLAVIELPTIVLSTLYHDFCADLYSTRQIWKNSSGIKDFAVTRFRRQEKRLLSIIALFLGAFLGGEMYKSRVGMVSALWTAAGLKILLSLGFVSWRKERTKSGILPK